MSRVPPRVKQVAAGLRESIWARLLAAGAVAAVALILVITLTRHQAHGPGQPTILPDVSATVGQLPQKSADHPPIKLTDQSRPVPTNSWLSGLVFQTKQSVVYASPWTYQATDAGASLSYPLVKSTPTTVFAQHTNDLTLDVGADEYRVPKFDDLSATVAYRQAGDTVATLTLVQGSPYVFVGLQPHQQLQLNLAGAVQKIADDQFTFTVQNKQYGLWLGRNASVQIKSSSLTVKSTDEPVDLTLIALPDGIDRALAFKLAKNIVDQTDVSYRVAGDTATTTFQLQTKLGQPTLFGLVPRQYAHGNNLPQPTGQLTTLAGVQQFYQGNSFSYSLHKFAPSADQIITQQLPSQQTSQLKQQLAEDIAQTKFTATDSYGAGKQLYRAANLLELAHEIDQPEAARQIHDKLQQQLALWLDPHGGRQRANKYFYYDPQIHGLVGAAPSFGSEHFNDHNFHYGYFVYAASVLGKYDDDFVDNHGDMVSALIRDYASPQATEHFPKLRSYGAYVGHAWADGYGDTPAGNNLESSSEAVNAAYAIYLWGRTTDNQRLQHFGQWLYQNQAAAARAYWTNIDTSAPQFANYQPDFVSLVWQGKLDSATFFSAAPAAKLGIQLIPMSPGQHYLAADPERITHNLSAVPDQPSLLADYLLMYQAMAEPDAALHKLDKIQPSQIDSADSASYLRAYTYNLNAKS